MPMAARIRERYKNYPVVKVPLLFAAFGGITGWAVAMLFLTLVMLSDMERSGFADDVLELGAVFVYGGVFAFFVGFVPALLTGLLLALAKAHRSFPGVAFATVLGAGVSAAFYVALEWGGSHSAQEIFTRADFWVFLGAGAGSALLLGLLLLPRPGDLH